MAINDNKARAARRLSQGLLLAGVSAATMVAAPAFAQTAPVPTAAPTETPPPQTAAAAASTQADAAPAATQDIVVTGSRLKSPNQTSPSPLQLVTAEQLQDRGAINVQEVLQLNPSFGPPGASRTTSDQNINQVGVSTVNLRNLGANRTLVLIDGRRVVAGVPGTAQVDLSMIPTPFVDRVDVLTGGASAVYGSDAVAGVVNFVYKKHFNGLELNAQSGISDYGDDSEYSLNLTVGHDFADGKGNFMAYAGYTKQGLVSAADRARTADDYYSLGNSELKANQPLASNLQAAKDIFTPFVSRSSVIPAGVFTVTAAGKSTNLVVDPSGAVRAYNGTTDGFNRERYQAIANPLERRLFAARATYDLGSGINFFLEGTYSSTRTTTYIEPSPILGGGSLGVFRGTSGYYNIEQYVTNPATGQTVKSINPLVPAAIYNAAGDTTGDGLKDISFSLRLADFPPGQRLAPTDRDTFRMVGGFEGDLGHNWNYNVYYEYGQTTLNQTMSNVVNEYNMANALNVIQDVFDFNKNGSTTDAVCADATARANGCVPINIYGRGNLSQAAINYVSTLLTHNSRLEQEVASAGLTGTLFNLPAGPVQLAFGAEYRRESSRDTFDPLSNTAMNGYVQEPNTSGSFNVKEAYGELQVPILHRSAVGDLSIRGAGRVSDYSTVGTVNAWNAGIEYAPIPDIRFRAVYARAVRAPNIGELYAPAAVSVTSVTDPCAGVTPTSTGATSARCRADPAVLANIAANNGVFTLNQSDTQGATVVSASNPNIQPENGTTYTLGVVVAPTSVHLLRNFVFTADYFNVSIDGAISRPSAQIYLNKCYVQNLDAFCSQIQRRATAAAPYSVGAIQQINQALVNSGGIWTEGIDLTLGYHQGLFGGTASANLAYTHLFKQGQRPLAGDPVDNLRGEIGTPTDAGVLTWGWESPKFGFTVTNQYLGRQYLDDQYTKLFVLADGTLPDSSYFRIGAKVYTDIQLRFNVEKRYQFYVGVDDLFNLTPPPVWQGLTGNVPNSETAAQYDAIGRRYYAGVRVRF